MKTKLRGNFSLFLIINLTAACGGGGDEDKQYVDIAVATRCAISTGLGEPNNCMPEKIEGDNYVTDQNTIHLSGFSSDEAFDHCTDLTNFDDAFSGAGCSFSTNPWDYGVSWVNATNGKSGNGSVRYRLYPSIGWSTYDGRGVEKGDADSKGIPLELGMTGYIA